MPRCRVGGQSIAAKAAPTGGVQRGRLMQAGIVARAVLRMGRAPPWERLQARYPRQPDDQLVLDL
ncbi:hypothetical protein CO641_11990 [Lysobacteraceae bacterium NML91-0213]|nr:hypothetical protein CO641_11990 [Xanthomonadaceae bacterium NML91-0213]